jgi:hypothetical protein
MMLQFPDSKSRIDLYKLESDLRDLCTELLSAQFAVNRLQLRYSHEEIAKHGGTFLVSKAITAASAMNEYLVKVRQYLPATHPAKSHLGSQETGK